MAKRLFQQSLSDHCVGRSLSFGKVVAYSPRGSLSHKRICLLYSVAIATIAFCCSISAPLTFTLYDSSFISPFLSTFTN